MNEAELPTLADLLSPTCFSEIARRIDRGRGFVWGLAHGRVLRDVTVIPKLAKALHQPESFLIAVVARDQKARRSKRRIAA